MEWILFKITVTIMLVSIYNELGKIRDIMEEKKDER